MSKIIKVISTTNIAILLIATIIITLALSYMEEHVIFVTKKVIFLISI